MDTLDNVTKKETKISKGLLGALAAGILIVAAIMGFWALQPTPQEVDEQALEGAVREGTPEFSELTRRIILQTDENQTTWSPTGLGPIVMNIVGNVRNITGKTITGLELKVTVVDSFGAPVKEKIFLAVPRQHETLPDKETVSVRTSIGGFKKDEDRANIRWKVTAIKTE